MTRAPAEMLLENMAPGRRKQALEHPLPGFSCVQHPCPGSLAIPWRARLPHQVKKALLEGLVLPPSGIYLQGETHFPMTRKPGQWRTRIKKSVPVQMAEVALARLGAAEDALQWKWVPDNAEGINELRPSLKIPCSNMDLVPNTSWKVTSSACNEINFLIICF